MRHGALLGYYYGSYSKCRTRDVGSCYSTFGVVKAGVITYWVTYGTRVFKSEPEALYKSATMLKTLSSYRGYYSRAYSGFRAREA